MRGWTHDRSDFPGSDPMLLQTVADFLCREAFLLDQRRYTEWFALWAGEGEILYDVPSGSEDSDASVVPSLMHDDREVLAFRVDRLSRQAAFAHHGDVRMIRGVMNLVIHKNENDCVDASSVVFIKEWRRGKLHEWTARCYYSLEISEDVCKIRRKSVALLDLDADLPLLGFLL